MKYMK